MGRGGLSARFRCFRNFEKSRFLSSYKDPSPALDKFVPIISQMQEKHDLSVIASIFFPHGILTHPAEQHTQTHCANKNVLLAVVGQGPLVPNM